MRPLGRAMAGLRAGVHGLASNSAWLAGVPQSLRITSPAFGPGVDIPAKYTTDGPGLSPPLAWEGVPEGTVSLALLIEDPDIPMPVPLAHAVVHGIPPSERALEEGAIPKGRQPGQFTKVGIGRNSFGGIGCLPINPPPGHGPHHYAFQLFALDIDPRFEWPPGRMALLRALRGHVVAWGMMFGVYERP